MKLSEAGLFIKAIRQEAGLSLSEFADLIGVSKSQVSKYENNRICVPYELLVDIGNALRVPPECLIIAYLRVEFESLRCGKTGRMCSELIAAINESKFTSLDEVAFANRLLG